MPQQGGDLKSSQGKRAVSAEASIGKGAGILRIGVCQNHVSTSKDESMKIAAGAIRKAAAEGAKMCILPEMWTCPYSTDLFRQYAETEVPPAGTLPPYSAPTISLLSCLARECGVWIIGGSMPEIDSSTNEMYNTCPSFNPRGELVAKYRKIHLADTSVPSPDGGMATVRESDVFSPGNLGPCWVETPWCTVGVGICRDLRFPEYALILSHGASPAADPTRLIVYPAAFNEVVGPAHFELLARARAMDTQTFVVACSPALDPSPDAVFRSHGHSVVATPFGDVLARCGGQGREVLVVDVDLDEVEVRRGQIPIMDQRGCQFSLSPSTSIGSNMDAKCSSSSSPLPITPPSETGQSPPSPSSLLGGGSDSVASSLSTVSSTPPLASLSYATQQAEGMFARVFNVIGRMRQIASGTGGGGVAGGGEGKRSISPSISSSSSSSSSPTPSDGKSISGTSPVNGLSAALRSPSLPIFKKPHRAGVYEEQSGIYEVPRDLLVIKGGGCTCGEPPDGRDFRDFNKSWSATS